MDLREKFIGLQKCHRIFNENYFDRNFSVITENNRQVQFNFRQSKLWDFFGISKKFIKGEGFHDNDYYSFTSLFGNKYEYINNNRDDIFTERSERVITSYLTMPILDGISMKFLVEDGDKIYIYINLSNNIEDGKLLTLKFDGVKYYIPVDVSDVKTREELISIIKDRKVEIISLVYKTIKYKDRKDGVEPTSKKFDLFKETSLFLCNLGRDEFYYSDKEIENIIYSSHYGITRIYSPSDFGFNFGVGRLKMNKNAYDVICELNKRLNENKEMSKQQLQMYKNMIIQKDDECNYYKELVEMLLSDMYMKENNNAKCSGLLKKLRRSK